MAIRRLFFRTLIGIFLSNICWAKFASKEEFAKAWDVPLTSQEADLFTYPKYGEFRRVNFIKDANFRGLFCTKGVEVEPSPKGEGRFFINMERGPKGKGLYCKHKDLVFSGNGEFFQKNSEPFEIVFFEVNELTGKENEINGVKFGNERIAFQSIDESRKRLKKMGFNQKFVLLDSAPKDAYSGISALFGEPIVINGTTFPAGTKVSLVGPENESDKDGDKITDVFIPDGQTVKINGVVCSKELDYFNGHIGKCVLGEKYKFLDGWIPKGTKVTFANELASDGKPVPYIIRRLSQHTTFQGKKFFLGETMVYMNGKVSADLSGVRLEGD